MAIDGKQLRDGSIATAKVADGLLSADAAGRAKMASGFFDATKANDAFAASALPLTKLAEAVIQADGGQAFTGDQSMGGFKLTNIGTPTAAGDAASKDYVDQAAAGLDPKANVRTATTDILDNNTDISGSPTYNNTGGTSSRGQITATLVASGTFTMDGVALASGDRVLLKDEGDVGGLGGDANGIYVVTISGTSLTLDRATDFDADDEVSAGAYMFVAEGTTLADSAFLLTTDDPITIGGASGTVLVFELFSRLDLGGVAPEQIDAGDAGTEGTSGRAARADHEHAVNTASPGTPIQSDAGTPSEGVATSLLRTDAQIVAATAAPSNVGTTNTQGTSTSLARADHVHAAPMPVTVDKALAPSNTTGDAQDTGIDLTSSPALGGYVEVLVNGVQYELGDGVTTADCYFSTDGGASARTISGLAAGMSLFWNGNVAGFDLSNANDVVDLNYEAF